MKDKKDFTAAIDVRRALLTRAGEELRGLPVATRSISKDTQGVLDLIQQCRAMCYAAMEYLSNMPYDAFPDSLYVAIYECLYCAGICMRLVGDESPLSLIANQLCAAACGQYVVAFTGIEDDLLKACAVFCGKTADACDSMAGSKVETKSAPVLDEQRVAFTCPSCGFQGDTDELNSIKETVEERAARMGAGEQVRSFKAEIRSAADGRKVIGYPILFNELSQDLGGFRERILPDAVQFSDDVRCDFNHSPDFILGRRSAGTLALTTDATGVRMVAEAPDTTWANDLLVSINRGDIDQGSFAFRVLPGGQQISVDDSGQQIRTLSKILVRRVSVVSDPAYTGTSIEVRSVPEVEAPASVDPAAPVTETPAVVEAPVAAAAPVAIRSTIHLRRRLELAGM